MLFFFSNEHLFFHRSLENDSRLPSTQPEPVQIHSPIQLVRRSSISTDSSHAAVLSFESQIRSLYDYPTCLMLRSILHWSIHDVGQFIEHHFPEKNIARVRKNSSRIFHQSSLFRNSSNRKSMVEHYHYSPKIILLVYSK